LGAGTGGLALEAARRGSSFVVAADFTLQMMHEGRRRSGAEEVRWMVTDAHQLPFSAGSFDVVVSGYLMRNVADLRRVWSEQYRVLKPGGRVICLDTTPPPRNLAHWVVHLYLRRGVPALGRLVAHARDAYAYLSDSTEEFLAAEELARCMVEAGFRDVGFRRFMFGAMALHWGRRADALPTQFQRYNQTQRESKPSP
jgi:demethylmenaquinone methyltransferase/2-methoxy-6-polyprenyl-1,4-benzoquinol methylase